MAFGNCIYCGLDIGNSATATDRGFAHPACDDRYEAARPPAEVIAELRERLLRVGSALRTQTECPCCRWPMPPDNDHYICPCCGFHVSYNDVESFVWDGEWWFPDREHGRPPEIVERLQAQVAKLSAENESLREPTVSINGNGPTITGIAATE